MAPQRRDRERYRILGEHGRGGLGRVSRVHDRELGRDIAIKELISRGDLGEIRFLREALITARLEHPGIVPVYEAGRWSDGTPFYAMKLVAGRPLRDLIAERATVEDRIGLLHHVITVADAIAYAHGRHIMHRDLKPANIIVGDFGETIVIDWGLAKDLSATDDPAASGTHLSPASDLTSDGAVLGTPAYMAPEQRRGAAVDQRADVFAIGAMLWELCALARVPPADPRERRRILRRAGIDQDLAAIIDKAVDPDPARRYRDAGALAADLKAFKSGARIAARRYSPLAMLAHWTRRHRTLALSAAVIAALGVAGSALYVRNIAVERDRADQERDRARLSAASLLLEKDPARAKDLLASLTVRSPQYALLVSRAQQRAAVWVLGGLAGVAGLFRAPGSAELALLTRDGELYRVDPRAGEKQLVDHEVTGAVASRGGAWLYARAPFGARTTSIASSPRTIAFDAGALTGIKRLVALRDAVYALDGAGDVYRIGREPPVRIRHGVSRIAGDGRTLVVCSRDGVLEVLRDGAVALRASCPPVVSPDAIGVVGDDYAAITAPGVLTIARGGRTRDVAVDIPGEYELALSRAGVVAIGSYARGGTTWFVAGDGAPEPGPEYRGLLRCVAAGGSVAAWGYADGMVIAIDTASGAVWQLRGHPDAVDYIAIEDDGKTLVSTSSQDLRVWHLTPPPVTRVARIPCTTYTMQVSADQNRVALDCHDGGVWVWSRSAGTVVAPHRHVGSAFGVQWLGDDVCSAGGDGEVVCSHVDGTARRTFVLGGGRIQWFTGSPRYDFVAIATADGRIWELDDRLHERYSQGAVPYRVAVSPDARYLASGGLDGSLVVFDRIAHRVAARVPAHRGAIRSVAWQADAIWTSGIDGALRQWSVAGNALVLRRTDQESGPLHRTKVFPGGWAASVGDSALAIHRDGAAALRLELDQHLWAVDVSPDARYVAASVLGEIVVVDLRDHRLATLAIDSAATGYVSFVDAHALAVSASNALKVVHVDDLDYLPF